MIKLLIIRWALRQIRKANLSNKSYEELALYGIEDILTNEHTGDKMYIL